MSGNGLDLKPGDKIGKYEILRVLAKGGGGVVYLAEQKTIKRKVVIKLITTKDEGSLALALARQEAEILASVDHPYIVDLYDVDEYAGYLYEVLEYVDGKSLSEMIESGDELSVTVVLKLMISIADALDYLHGLGIIHGDVKPANIVMSSGGNPLLVDLGLSGSSEDDLLHGRIMGTRSYRPPEAWRGEREERSDLWALGMTLHYLLTGRVAFKVTDEEELAKLIASEAPLDISDLRKSVPEPVVRIVERCLQKDLDRRYQSAVEVRRDLESALAYLESGQSKTAAMAMAPLWAGSTILLNVEYKEPGIPGQYREYKIKEVLGQGGFAIVYRAEDVIGHRQVALKILRRERADSEKTLVRFRREASLLARLDHPNIVRVHNFGRYVADFFIVMEVLAGPTIRDALDCGFEFKIEDAVVVVAQVLDGLERIHAEGVIHRDVKPENIKLQPERAVVMDLGLAHISGSAQLTMSGDIFGTPRYMAPEQACGQKVTFHSDLYAAGVVLYELLTGEIPHKADSPVSLIFKIVLEDPDPITEFRSDLPSSLVAFLSRVLAREPTGRFSSTQLAREELLASVGLRNNDVATIHRRMFDELQQMLL